jgi:hypothetical protein
MNRLLIELLRLAGLLGCGLSLAGLFILVTARIEFVAKQGPNGGLDSKAGLLQVLDAFKEPGIAFLLSANLYVVCTIALQRIRPRNGRNESAASSDH